MASTQASNTPDSNSESSLASNSASNPATGPASNPATGPANSAARTSNSDKAKAQSVKTVAIIAVLVVLLVGAVYAYMQWQNNRPPTDPREVTVTATVGDNEVETTPYMVCEPGVECPENEVPTLQVSPDDTVRIEVPEDVYDHDWQLLTIYDDPGANDQQFHGPNDTNTVDVPVSAAPVGDSTENPQLVVIEVSSIMIGPDDAGAETPYMTTWSFAFEQ